MRVDAEDATWPEAAAAAAVRRPAVLPFGALEQHGPHLPLSTDTLMAAALATRVADAIGAWLLPAVPFGDTSANEGFPGTLSLSFETVRAVARDVARSVEGDGFSCLIVVNGDYGNQAPLRLAARDVAGGSGFPVLIIDYPGLPEIAAELCETEPAGPGFYHADEFETSVVLAVRPDLVHEDRAMPAYPDMPATLGSTPIALHKLSPSGVFGDPRPSSAVKGRRILDLLSERAVEVVGVFLSSLAEQGHVPGP